MKRFYDGCLKIFVRELQRLLPLGPGISGLSFLSEDVIFLVLEVTRDFLLYPEHFGYDVKRRLILSESILACHHLFKALCRFWPSFMGFGANDFNFPVLQCYSAASFSRLHLHSSWVPADAACGQWRSSLNCLLSVGEEWEMLGP